MDVDIPARLNAALARTNISQQTLARRLGVGKSTVSHWVNGHREISIEIAGRIAEALRVEEGGVELHVNAAWLAFAMGEMLIPVPIKSPTRKPRTSTRTKPLPKPRTPRRALPSPLAPTGT